MKKIVSRTCMALCVCFCAESAFGYIAAPSNPNALQVTSNLYNYIATRAAASTNKMIVGQHLGGINEIQNPGEFDITNYIESATGKLPAMVGTRYDSNNNEAPGKPYTLTAAFCTQLNNALIAIWNADQPIIHITAVPPNPWNWESGREPYQNTNNIGDLRLSAPSSPQKTSFWSSIDIIADALQELQDAGVPVLFRPFPEFNQTDKYYFYKQSSTNFVALWTDVYNYYVNTKGLNNLLFCWEVWALNRNTNSANIAPWYPNETNYVDVVAGAFYFAPESSIDYLDDVTGEFSFDNSDPEDQGVYDFLVGRNRPFGAAQFGLDQGGTAAGDQNETLAFMDYSPQLAFAYFWKGYQAWNIQSNADDFANESRVATCDDLPVFTPDSSASFTSTGSEDGYVLESSETSNLGGTATAGATGTAAIRFGDDASKKQFKAFASFDTSALPDDAIIVSATLKLKRGYINSDPSGFGTITADIKGGSGFSGSTALTTNDFQAASDASAVATMSYPANNGDWSTGTVSETGLACINKTGKTQFRLQFATDDDNDAKADYLGFYSGANSDPANYPVLEIHYY